MNENIKKIIGNICDENNPRKELNTVCIDFESKRVYTTNTRQVIIVNIPINPKSKDIYYIDKDTFTNAKIDILENGIFIGINEIKPYTNNKEFKYPDLDSIIPSSFKHIYEIADFHKNKIHYLLGKHEINYTSKYIDILEPFLGDENKVYLKFNDNNKPIVITIESNREEFLKYIFMPIIDFKNSNEKYFKKLRRAN